MRKFNRGGMVRFENNVWNENDDEQISENMKRGDHEIAVFPYFILHYTPLHSETFNHNFENGFNCYRNF